MIIDGEAPATLPLEQARAVTWPFREFKGQTIGSLLDSGAINLKDLGFAAERAFNPRVQAAARTLLLNRLLVSDDQTQSPTGPVNVIRSEWRSFAERRQIQIAMLMGLIPGLVSGALILLLIIYVISAARSTNSEQSSFEFSTQVVVFALVYVVFSIVALNTLLIKSMDWVLNKLEYQLKLHRKGQLAEERVLNVLYHHLDRQWWVFRNLQMPGKKAGDVDFVVVGPSGVWALEVKALSGEYRNVGDRWEKRWRQRWLSAFTNPSKQAKRNATAIHHVLQTHQIKQWISPIIVWANEDAPIAIENPAVPVWRLSELGDGLHQVSNGYTLADVQREKVITALKSLYKQPFADDDEA